MGICCVNSKNPSTLVPRNSFRPYLLTTTAINNINSNKTSYVGTTNYSTSKKKTDDTCTSECDTFSDDDIIKTDI